MENSSQFRLFLLPFLWKEKRKENKQKNNRCTHHLSIFSAPLPQILLWRLWFFFTAHIESEEFPLSAFPEQCPMYNNYVCYIFHYIRYYKWSRSDSKYVGGLLAKTTLFHRRDLGICREYWKQFSEGTEGWLYCVIIKKKMWLAYAACTACISVVPMSSGPYNEPRETTTSEGQRRKNTGN